MINILVNAMTIRFGGGLQVTLNFIKHTLNNPSNVNWVYIVPKFIFDELDILSNKNFFIIDTSPRSLIFKQKQKRIREIERINKIDLVYSIGAPSYFKFISPEVLRLTNPWLIYDSKFAYTSYNFIDRFKYKFLNYLKQFYIKQNHFIITQTDDAKEKISKKYKIKQSNINVIANTSPLLNSQLLKKQSFNNSHINIFCLATPYNHKNIDIIPLVILELLNKGLKSFKFIVTIPDNFINSSTTNFFNLINEHKLHAHIHNLGLLRQDECPQIYLQSHIFFMPTLLEVFSASLIESMAYNLPIVTTNLSFNKSICKKSALYFKPKDPSDAAKKLYDLIINDELYGSIANNSANIIKDYNFENTYEKHIWVLKEIIKNES